MKTVNILLSTYNGERFIEEQLNSLMAQTYPSIRVYIRDDGSVDSTLQLLEKYCRNRLTAHPVFLIPNPSKKNIGYRKSFWLLLRECEPADYYAFCDQDDVWLPDKISLGVSALSQKDDSIPRLYFSSYNYCDDKMQLESPAPLFRQPIRLKDVMFYTPAFGFTILMNQRLRELALSTSDVDQLPHDGWCQKLAASQGEIIYDPTRTANYRRHKATVTVAGTTVLSYILHWLRHDIFGSHMEEMLLILEKLNKEFETELNPDAKTLLEIFTCRSGKLTYRLRRIFYPLRFRPSPGGELALRICFLIDHKYYHK